MRERERVLGLSRRSVLAAAHEHGVPIYTSSPGDSSIGMNVAALALVDNKLTFDVSRDVNETAAIVLAAKEAGGKSGVADHRRRLAEELRAADRAADSGSARHRREGPRLLSCSSPTRGRTPAASPAPRRARR